jgi:transcriptional regulator with XRE-family HTH domain
MSALPGSPPATVGALLRTWRHRRRLSQLDLSLEAGISARHLSFVETGRSAPSRDMVLRLCDHLDLPLRERNRVLLAAGYAPAYPETPIRDPAMRAVRDAVRQVLTGHEPYPAVVVDRYWDLVDANAASGLLTAQVSPALLAPPHANVLRATLHPDGLAPHIVNLGEWRAHLLHRLHRQIAFSGDPRLAELAEELRGYPCDQPEPEPGPGPGRLVVPLRVRTGRGEAALISTVATFGTPLDITLEELCIESFYPADPFTAGILRDAAR